MSIQDAIALFDQGQYKEAFERFAMIYNESENLQEQQNIMSILQEAYYAPNVDELQENYEKNIAALSDYPYFWDKQFTSFSDLSFLLFPTGDDSYYVYDKQIDRFIGEYDGTTRHQMRYFFQNLDHAIKVEDEDNLYNLTFLFDNVRRSEDVAMDNHIYLLYNSWCPLQRVLQVGDITPILEHQKFVFLIGKQNHRCYPINFKKKFGIEYHKMDVQPVRIQEVKRICYWYKHAYSGTMLSYGILDASSVTGAFYAHDFHTYSTINNSNIQLPLSKILENPYFETSISDIYQLLEQDVSISLPDIKPYLQWLAKRYEPDDTLTVLDIFKSYFIYKQEQKKPVCRITPLIFFDPHIWRCDIYNKILHEFPYCITLTCMRNPITVFGRSYQYGLIGWDRFQTQYILASDYTHAQFLSEQLKKNYWGFRFEDLKTKPESTIRSICKQLNIPFEQNMLDVQAPMTDRAGNTVRGFDHSPLQRDISNVLSDFDQMRLKIFYDPILEYYDYPRFSFQNHPMSEALIRELLSIPFVFESYNHIAFEEAPSTHELHKWIQGVLQNSWKKKITVPKLISLEEVSNE